MCDRGHNDAKPIQTISTQAAFVAGGTVTIPQRVGRVRVVFSISTLGAFEVYAESVNASNFLVAGSNPANPVTLDFEHYGAVVHNKLVVRNPSANPETIGWVELIEGY